MNRKLWVTLLMLGVFLVVVGFTATQADTSNEVEDTLPTPILAFTFEDEAAVFQGEDNMLATCAAKNCPETGVLGRQSLSGALSFDGADNYLTLPTASEAGMDGSFTVVTWLQGSDFSQAEQVILGDSKGEVRLSVRDKRPFMTLNGFNVNSGATRLLDHKWYHVAWRYDAAAGEQALFLDGHLENIGPAQNGVSPTAVLQLGRSGTGSYYKGLLDDISIYDKPLTNGEIFALATYNPHMPTRYVHAIDLNVNLSGATASNAHYEDMFRSFADALYDMSEGGMYLRNIRFGNYSGQKVDVQWPTNCRPNAHVGAYEQSWGRIEMCDYFRRSDGSILEDYTNPTFGSARGGYTLAHEAGHYVLGLLDEYRGSSEPTDIRFPRSSDVPVNYSMMNYGRNAAGQYVDVCKEWYPWWEFWNWGRCKRTGPELRRGDLRWGQLSTRANNTRQTAQHRGYQASGWETLVRPTSQDPAHAQGDRQNWPHLQSHPPNLNALPPAYISAGARNYLTFHWYGSGRRPATSADNTAMPNALVRVYVVDISQSMTAEQLQQVQNALKQRVEQMPDGDSLSIITFSSTPTVIQSFVDVNDTTRDGIKTAIDAIALGDTEVATGDAIELAVTNLTADVPDTVYKSIHVIGTGETTTGITLQAAGDLVEAAFIDLYAYNYETSPDAGYALRDLAEENYGTYAKVSTQNELLNALKAAEEETSFSGFVGIKSDYQSIDSQPAYSTTIAVDDSLGEVEFIIGYWGEVDEDTLLLEDPDQQTIPFDPLEDCEDWSEPGEPLFVCYLDLLDPTPGVWYLHVDTAVGTPEAPIDFIYWADGYMKEDATPFYAFVQSASGESVAMYPEPMVVVAGVRGELPVAGMVVTATVDAPNGEYDIFELRDDGLIPDEIANDGLYTGYLDYWMDGEYFVTVNFSNQGDAIYSDEGVSLHDEVEYDLLGHPLDRYAEFQFSIVDWQTDDHDDDFTNNPTPLTVDNARVSGRIDYDSENWEGVDVDTFVFTPTLTSHIGDPNVFNPDDIYLRVTNLGLEMDPDVYIYDSNGDLVQNVYFEYIPDNSDYLLTPITVTAEMVSQPFYVEVMHWDPNASMGVYKISVGPHMEGDNPPDLGVGVDMIANAPLGESPDGSTPPPNMMVKNGMPGEVVTYTHTITNTGVHADNVLIEALLWPGWSLEFDIPGAPAASTVDGATIISRTVPIPPQGQVSFEVRTTIPADVEIGNVETIFVDATSQTAEKWEYRVFSNVVRVGPMVEEGYSIYLPMLVRNP